MLMPTIFGTNLFDDFFDDFMMPQTTKDFYSNSLMRTDIKEHDDSYELDIDLPGYAKEDIKAQLKDGYLTVSASKKENKDQKNEEGQYIRRERYAGSMSRSYYVGKDLDEKDVHAKFEDGILKLTFPKEKPAQVEEQNVISIEG